MGEVKLVRTLLVTLPYCVVCFCILLHFGEIAGSTKVSEVSQVAQSTTAFVPAKSDLLDNSNTVASTSAESKQEVTNELDLVTVNYSLKNDTYKIVSIPANTSVKISVNYVRGNETKFLIFQAHSQSKFLILSHNRTIEPGYYVNNTNPGLVVYVNQSSQLSPKAYLSNYHDSNISTLIIIQNYSRTEPIPGGLPVSPTLGRLPHPYLFLTQNLLTTAVTFFPAILLNQSDPTSGLHYFQNYNGSAYNNLASYIVPSERADMKYEIYLTYMYEGDMHEQNYWDAVIATSNIEGLRNTAKKVSQELPDPSIPPTPVSRVFVSYSGVGAVVSVLVSANGSVGALYSASVFYGCNFIPGEEYRCTKLVNPLAMLFCASLLFIGGVLLHFGHRWLNFTMFIAGFMFTWCMLFIIFSNTPYSNIDALGVGTLFGAVLGGLAWLLMWHKIQRPFHSAILIILLAAFLSAMVSTHFLKYAVVPTHRNLAAFVVFPVVFAMAVVAYSIKDIKRVHIFSCTLLGSYGLIVPFAFYFGSSLTYIVINVISTMTVPNYSTAVGYPPFQSCDIILLCAWIALFIIGTAFQLYKERSSPPFHPPSLAFFRSVAHCFRFIYEKLLWYACGRDPSDSLSEDQPTLWSHVVSAWHSCIASITCRGEDTSSPSGYQSFPRVQPDRVSLLGSELSSSRATQVWSSMVNRWQSMKERMKSGSSCHRATLEESTQPLHSCEDGDEELEDVACCAFKKSKVVLNDTCTETDPQPSE